MARVTPEKAEQLSWPIVQIYSSIQTEILENIGALLAKDTKALEADVNQWYALKLEQARTDRRTHTGEYTGHIKEK
ncbi:hypothetical protein ACFQ9L_20700 [Bacillus velezensis]